METAKAMQAGSRQPELLGEISTCKATLNQTEEIINELTGIFNLIPEPATIAGATKLDAPAPHFNKVQDRGMDIQSINNRLNDCNRQLARIIEVAREI